MLEEVRGWEFSLNGSPRSSLRGKSRKAAVGRGSGYSGDPYELLRQRMVSEQVVQRGISDPRVIRALQDYASASFRGRGTVGSGLW